MVEFLFHDSLNDFLPRKEKEQWKKLSLKTSSSVKDAMEAIGVPHVEVMKIVVNGSEKEFTYLLQPADQAEVYPYETHFPQGTPQTFILDVHLGKLARLLRMMGIDAAYQNHWHDKEIVAMAVQENRSVLTRDVGLLKHKVLKYGYWLRSQEPEEQLMEVIQRFSLCDCLRPFSRCMACNGLLKEVPKAGVLHLLPAQTRDYFPQFYQCIQCKNVYWKGSHFENMQCLIDHIKSLAC